MVQVRLDLLMRTIMGVDYSANFGIGVEIDTGYFEEDWNYE